MIEEKRVIAIGKCGRGFVPLPEPADQREAEGRLRDIERYYARNDPQFQLYADKWFEETNGGKERL